MILFVGAPTNTWPRPPLWTPCQFNSGRPLDITFPMSFLVHLIVTFVLIPGFKRAGDFQKIWFLLKWRGQALFNKATCFLNKSMQLVSKLICFPHKKKNVLTDDVNANSFFQSFAFIETGNNCLFLNKLAFKADHVLP